MQNLKFDFQKYIESTLIPSESYCSYYPGKISSFKVFYYGGKLNPIILEHLINAGFRRSNNLYYQTGCPACTMCLSYRVLVDKFKLAKSQKRVLKRNRDIKINFSKPYITEEKERLYLDYQYFQHFLKPSLINKDEFDEEKTINIMYEQMYGNIQNSIEMELLSKDRLVGFAIFDVAIKSISAVYSVFDPHEKVRSLGTYMILKSIEWALRLDYKYCHLGFFIPGHPKMDYKSNFKPAEIRNPYTGKWEDSEKYFID